MAVITHIQPGTIYRAAALQALITRGFTIDLAVELAYEAAEKMEALVDNKQLDAEDY